MSPDYIQIKQEAPFSLFTTPSTQALKTGRNPNPGLAQDKKMRETVSKPLHPALDSPSFCVPLFPDGPRALQWPFHHSRSPPRQIHSGNIFIIPSLPQNAPAHLLFPMGPPGRRLQTHSWTLLWTDCVKASRNCFCWQKLVGEGLRG